MSNCFESATNEGVQKITYMTNSIKIISIFVFIACIVYLVVKRNKINSNNPITFSFRAKILSIKKQYRGRYDLELVSKNRELFLAVDRNFNEINDIIKIGDSLVKEDTNDCAIYLNNDTVINRCKIELYDSH